MIKLIPDGCFIYFQRRFRHPVFQKMSKHRARNNSKGTKNCGQQEEEFIHKTKV